jgi:integrase
MTERWTREELGRFVEHVEDDPHRGLWLLACTTGLTADELVAIRRHDVDLDQGLVATTRDGEHTTFVLDSTTWKAMRDHIIAWDQETETAPRATEHLFHQADRASLSADEIHEQFTQICRDAHLPAVDLETTRETYADLALRVGMPSSILSERLGESCVREAAGRHRGESKELAEPIDLILRAHEKAPVPPAFLDTHHIIESAPSAGGPENEESADVVRHRRSADSSRSRGRER